MTDNSICFAKKGTKCLITKNESCPNNCGFRKSEDKFRQDFLKSKNRLQKLGILENCRCTYSVLDSMCRVIK